MFKNRIRENVKEENYGNIWRFNWKISELKDKTTKKAEELKDKAIGEVDNLINKIN